MKKSSYINKAHFELYDAFIPVFRLLGIIILFGILLYSNGFDLSKTYQYSFIAVYFAYALVLLFFKKIRKTVAYKYPFIIPTFEMIMITYGIISFGASSISFYYLYLLDIAFFAIVYSFKYSLIASSMCAVCYIIANLILDGRLSADAFNKVGFLLIFACFTGLINQSLNKYNMNMAIYDTLTSLYNRQYFYGEFEEMIVLSNKRGVLSLVIMDVDNFKQINDQQGHIEGDRILSEIGAVIRNHIRDGDIAARYGGDEFVIILQNTDMTEALSICDRLKYNIRERFLREVTISTGLAVYPNDGLNAQDLFRAADLAMYRAKLLGKNLKY